MIPVPKPSFKRKAPKKSVRGNFNRQTRQKIYERDEGLCRNCGSIGEEIHHVKYRSQNGRGVYTNGLTLCSYCHRKVHRERELSEHWMNKFEELYGKDYYKDEWDR